LLIHIEIQVSRDGRFEKRMYIYAYRLFDKYDHEVVSLAILGDDEEGWRPDHYAMGRFGCRTEFTFPAIKLLDYRDDLESSKQVTIPLPSRSPPIWLLSRQKTMSNDASNGRSA